MALNPWGTLSDLQYTGRPWDPNQAAMGQQLSPLQAPTQNPLANIGTPTRKPWGFADQSRSLSQWVADVEAGNLDVGTGTMTPKSSNIPSYKDWLQSQGPG